MQILLKYSDHGSVLNIFDNSTRMLYVAFGRECPRDLQFDPRSLSICIYSSGETILPHTVIVIVVSATRARGGSGTAETFTSVL